MWRQLEIFLPGSGQPGRNCPNRHRRPDQRGANRARRRNCEAMDSGSRPPYIASRSAQIQAEILSTILTDKLTCTYTQFRTLIPWDIAELSGCSICA